MGVSILKRFIFRILTGCFPPVLGLTNWLTVGMRRREIVFSFRLAVLSKKHLERSVRARKPSVQRLVEIIKSIKMNSNNCSINVLQNSKLSGVIVSAILCSCTNCVINVLRAVQ